MIPFRPREHVNIIPLEGVDARVIKVEFDSEGWMITCRYFQNGEEKTTRLFPDEISRPPGLAPATSLSGGPQNYAMTRRWVLKDDE